MPIVQYQIDGDTVTISTAGKRSVTVTGGAELLEALRQIAGDPAEPKASTEPGAQRNGEPRPDWHAFQQKVAAQVEHTAAERHGPVLGRVAGDLVRNPGQVIEGARALSSIPRSIGRRWRAKR